MEAICLLCRLYCPAPTTYHIAALTIRPPIHGIEMLAPKLSPARRTHKAANMKDAVQGHNPCSIPNHVFSAATTPAWGQKGTVNLHSPGSQIHCPSDSSLPPFPSTLIQLTKVLPIGWVAHVVHQLLGKPLKLLLRRLAQGNLRGENQGLGSTSSSRCCQIPESNR